MKKKGTNIIRRFIPRVLRRSLKTDLQFPQLLDASPDPILITNIKSEISYVNPAWEHLTGYRFQEVIGRNPRFLKSGKTPPQHYQKLWKTLEKGKTYSTEEVINKKKNGREYQIHSTFFPIRKNGRNHYFVQTQHDITQQKAIERHKDAFIGIASHELKTPLTTLLVYTQLLERRLQNKIDEKERYFIKNIKQQTDRLNGLINDLLSVSRIESGRLEIHCKEFDLNQLVTKVIVDFQYTTDSHKLIKEGVIDRKVKGDERKIEEVLINLLTNAFKYSPQAEKIILHLSQDKKNAVVGVQDFGFGISNKDLIHIFERFYRTKDKNEGKIAGFGLGLYICSQIIKRHKGKMWVESKKGKGSTFFFSLPLA